MRQCAPARTLTSAALALLTVALAAGPAGATTSISACGSLTAFGETYNVTTDLTSCGVCLLVLNDRITINLQGHSITASCASETLLPDGVAGGGIDDSDGPRDAVTVKNGTIVGYEIGINLAATSRAQVRNISATANGDGIAVGSQGLVKSSWATSNSGHGIVVSDRGQVQDCRATSNGSVGILAGNNCLITRNTASFNGEEGIATGSSCTVSYNTADSNTDDGIDVGFDASASGSHSLVTGNSASGNGDVGIEATCPSAVTNNTAQGNDTNYFFRGGDCFTNNNKGVVQNPT